MVDRVIFFGYCKFCSLQRGARRTKATRRTHANHSNRGCSSRGQQLRGDVHSQYPITRKDGGHRRLCQHGPTAASAYPLRDSRSWSRRSAVQAKGCGDGHPAPSPLRAPGPLPRGSRVHARRSTSSSQAGHPGEDQDKSSTACPGNCLGQPVLRCLLRPRDKGPFTTSRRAAFGRSFSFCTQFPYTGRVNPIVPYA